MARIPLVVVKTQAEEVQVRDLLKQLVEYILAMRIELERKPIAGQPG